MGLGKSAIGHRCDRLATVQGVIFITYNHISVTVFGKEMLKCVFVSRLIESRAAAVLCIMTCFFDLACFISDFSNIHSIVFDFSR